MDGRDAGHDTEDAMTLTAITRRMSIESTYRRLVADGCGYSVGAEDDEITDCDDLGQHLGTVGTGDEAIAVYAHGNWITLLGDNDGTWAVDVWAR